MSLSNVQGLVLRTVKYAESSVICDVYTREYGLRTYILNGVRTNKSRIAPGLARPMAWVEMVVYHQEQKDINRVKEVRAAYAYERIPYEVLRGNVGLLMVEWARHCLQEAQANGALYDFLWDSFVHLDQAEHFANVHLWFIARMTHFLGFLPPAPPAMEEEEEECCWDYQEKRYWTQIPQHTQYLDALNTRLLNAFNELPLEALAELPLNLDWRRGFIEAMFRFYAYHMDHFRTVNSFRILQEVLHR